MAFKFQNILNHRKLLLDGQYIILSKVQDELMKINLKINGVHHSLNLFKKEFPSRILSITNINDNNRLNAEYSSLSSKLDGLLKIKDSLMLDLEVQKAHTLKAKVEYEKINKLREKYLAKDKVALLKSDEAIANDFAVNRYGKE